MHTRHGWRRRSSRARDESTRRPASARTASTRRSTRDGCVRRAFIGARAGSRGGPGRARHAPNFQCRSQTPEVRRSEAGRIARLASCHPNAQAFPPSIGYASLQMPDDPADRWHHRGDPRLQAPVPALSDRPGLRGRFRVVQVDVVLEDMREQVAAGAEHITFGDPDFLNGPAHAALVERVTSRVPGPDLRRHHQGRASADASRHLPLLRDTGCLFVTSAVESIDDAVLARLERGTREPTSRRGGSCRAARVDARAHVRAVHAVDHARGLPGVAGGPREAGADRARGADPARDPTARDLPFRPP